ncbi:MAG: hypothetical protein V1858_04035 [Candidatus Gottesmanbacteria bacterium]
MIISLYLIILSFLTVFSYRFIDDNFPLTLPPYIHDFTHLERSITTIIFIVILFFMFTGFTILWRQVVQKRISTIKLKYLITFTVIILIFAYPAFSNDIFNYMATARVSYFYQENPYIMMPIEFIGEPMLKFMHAANKIALYGPIWIGLTFLPFLTGLGNIILTLISFKIFITLFYVGIICLIWKLSNHNLSSLVFFSLNPLVLIETLISSHNDIVMMFFVLFSLLLIKKYKVFALFMFLFSILIKYSTITLIPIYLYILWKNIKKQKIDWENIYLYAAILMFLTMLIVAPLREEIYPWYGIWFLTFLSLVPKIELQFLSLVFSLGLLLRYVPFMLWGTYFGPTPVAKTILMITPIGLMLFLHIFRKLWLKKFLR